MIMIDLTVHRNVLCIKEHGTQCTKTNGWNKMIANDCTVFSVNSCHLDNPKITKNQHFKKAVGSNCHREYASTVMAVVTNEYITYKTLARKKND